MPVRYIPHPIRAEAQDLAGARFFNTTYQNIRLRPIVVAVTISTTVVPGGFGLASEAILRVAAVTPPVNPATQGGYTVAPAVVLFSHWQLVALIPPGWYYRTDIFFAGGNGVALTDWWEWWL